MLFTIIDKSVLILTDNPQPGSRLGILFGQDVYGVIVISC